jgi:hypothetical protein
MADDLNRFISRTYLSRQNFHTFSIVTSRPPYFFSHVGEVMMSVVGADDGRIAFHASFDEVLYSADTANTFQL